MEKLKLPLLFKAIAGQLLGIVMLFINVKLAIWIYIIYAVIVISLFIVLIKERKKEKEEEDLNDYRDY